MPPFVIDANMFDQMWKGEMAISRIKNSERKRSSNPSESTQDSLIAVRAYINMKLARNKYLAMLKEMAGKCFQYGFCVYFLICVLIMFFSFYIAKLYKD